MTVTTIKHLYVMSAVAAVTVPAARVLDTEVKDTVVRNRSLDAMLLDS